jgi:hypothetical protein
LFSCDLILKYPTRAAVLVRKERKSIGKYEESKKETNYLQDNWTNKP